MLSVITPTNDISYLRKVYGSLICQSCDDWEWIIVTNGDAKISGDVVDTRIRIVEAPEGMVGNVGALKRFACQNAQGEILVELDHDDQLMPGALAAIKKAFDEYPVGMVYGNCARVNEDWSPNFFADGYGWEYREREAFGHKVWEVISPAPLPQNISRILYAPDHPRAYRTSSYWEVGGHNAELPLADDHELTLRFYLHSGIHHIDELLYIYRVHRANNWQARCEEIQQRMYENHDRYIGPMATRWADDNGLLKLDLGGGLYKKAGFLSVDQVNGDIEADLSKRWPFKDNSVGVIVANDFFEHLPDKIHTMQECHRVLAHGGFVLSLTPSSDGRGAFQDPTHVSYWNEHSFWYWTRENQQQYVRHAGGNCRFQALRLRNCFPNIWAEQNNIPYVQADLVALKDGMRFHGEVLI